MEELSHSWLFFHIVCQSAHQEQKLFRPYDPDPVAALSLFVFSDFLFAASIPPEEIVYLFLKVSFVHVSWW